MTRGRWWAVAGVAVGIAVLLVLMGAGLPHAALGGMVWVVGVIVVVNLGLGQRVSLPRLPFDRRDGARSEVSALSWALYGSDGVSPQAARMLRQVCREGLGEAGVDVGTTSGASRSTELLGAPLTAFLRDPEAPPPDVRLVRAAVLALENLEKSV